MNAALQQIASQPLFAVGLTLLAYSGANAVWIRSGRTPYLNPVFTASATLVAGLSALGIPYTAYIAQAAPIDDALAAIVVLLAVPLCRQYALILTSLRALAVALAAGAATALFTALFLPLVMGDTAAILATLGPKSATTAVAVEVSERFGGLPGLTAVIVISTGIFGAAFGPAILDRAGVTDDRARGFALGLSSHAIGTARAFQMSETSGAFASLGMILNAVAIIVLLPPLLAVLT